MSKPHPEMAQVTAERAAIEPTRSRRPFGIRLWLGLMFAGIGILTGTSVYLFVQQSSEGAAESQSEDLAVGRTTRLREQIEGNLEGRSLRPKTSPVSLLQANRTESYRTWLIDRNRKLLSEPRVFKFDLRNVPNQDQAIDSALAGSLYVDSGLPNDRNVVATPIRGEDFRIEGVLLAFSERPEEVSSALRALRGERLTALALAALVAAIIGGLVASLITSRIKNLASSAADIASGRLDRPLRTRGRDEIGDLGRALDSMRLALRESFDALSSERDRLSEIFEALTEAVIVVDRDGTVRFANHTADEFIVDGRVIPPLRPWIRRASERGQAGHGGLRLETGVYALEARNLPAENAALVVVRDRTEELRREIAEREFVSNAAHELRNPIAGISGAIEVLRSGAKDDPEARDHFLNRLSQDVERVTRLTRSLLTLARMEAVGEGEAEVVSVEIAVSDVAAAVAVPSGVELRVEVEDDLGAEADPVLVRQVLIGLLTNAFKNTPAPGTVTLRGRRDGDQVLIEVADTGTGIVEDEKDRVFERFYRGSGSLEQEGFGLGLSIAKRMITVMGGEIGVESESGEGSTFWIRLPMAKPSLTPVA